MKKKIIAIALCVALVAVGIVGATLAYFTDEEQAKNVFTSGTLDITLNDEFEQGSELLPAVVDENSGINNAVEKIVSVTNEDDSKDAYVRVHIAIPESIRDVIGLWTFEGAEGWEGTNDTRVDTPTYTAEIDGVDYVVFVYTYTELLEPGDTTTKILEAVTMEPDTTKEQVAEALDKDGNFNILVFAEGVQATGFSDAETALSEAFDVPGSEGYVAPWNKTAE